MKFTKARVYNAAYNTFTDLAGGNKYTCVVQISEPLD